MAYLYRYENKGIQGWLLDAGRLRDLEGGSDFIEAVAAMAKERSTRSNGKIVQAAAGGMTAIFPDRASIEAFASEWPAHLYYLMPDLPVVQAWVEFSGAEPRAKDFDTLFAKLHARRNLVWPALPEAGPIIARASRTGRPAIAVPEKLARGNRGLLVDGATARRQQARSRRHSNTLDLDGHSYTVQPNGEEWLQDGNAGTVAVLHADATGVGQRITDLAAGGLTVRALKSFSDALAAAMKQAVAAGLRALPTNREGEIDVNPIVLGGDDVTLLMPARHSMRFVAALVHTFEEATRADAERLGGEGLSLGVGVCYVHPHHPFHRAYELAEADCNKAKSDVRERGVDARPGPTSGVRLRRVTTSLEDAGSETAHSWSTDDLPTLEALVKAVRALPRGALRTFLTPAESGDLQQAKRLWGRIAEVQQDERPKAWDRLCETLEACGADPDTGQFKDNVTAEVADEDRTNKDGTLGASPRPSLHSPLFDALSLDHLDAYGLRDMASAEPLADGGFVTQQGSRNDGT